MTTKILFTSDWHVDASTAGLSRFAESASYIDALVRACNEHKVDVVCFLGDAFDPGSMMEGAWSSFMFDAHFRLTYAAALGSVFITGNHDVLDASVAMSTLSPLAIGSRLHGAAFATRKTLVAEMPAFVSFSNELGILALPYVSRAAMRDGQHRDAFVSAVSAAASAKRRTGAKVVAIGHYALPGIVPGSEEEMMRGRDIPIPAHELKELGCELVVNGHYHARQTVVVDGLTVEVVGAPTRFTFGEADDGERGFIIAEV